MESRRVMAIAAVVAGLSALSAWGQEPSGVGTQAVTVAAIDREGAAAADTPAAGLSGGEALLSKVVEGGWTMAVLLALSVVAGATTIERFSHLRAGAFVPGGLAEEVRDLWQRGDFDAVGRRCRERPSVYGRIVAYLAEHHGDSPEMLAQEAEELGQQEIWRHVRRTKPLSIVATLSPLLGLFGTVLGMIESFDTVALMGELGDASMLAGGISKALITTAGGLLVAIPALGLYYHLRSRAEQLGHLVECELTELLRCCVRRRNQDGTQP